MDIDGSTVPLGTRASLADDRTGRGDTAVAGITGLGRTLADGHQHEVDWSRDAVEAIIRTISSTGDHGRAAPEIEALVQAVVVTDDASASAAELAGLIPGSSVDDLLDAPFVWIGTVEEIAAKLAETETALGISRYVVRARAMNDARQIIDVVTSAR